MEAILQAQRTSGREHAAFAANVPGTRGSRCCFISGAKCRAIHELQRIKHLVDWGTVRPLALATARAKATSISIRAGNILFIGVDELTMFTLRQWQFLTSRNRCPAPGAFPCMAGATNPGNIGHAWVKSLWIDRQAAPGMEHPEEYDAADYEFIPARVCDNPDLRTGRELSEDAAKRCHRICGGRFWMAIGMIRGAVFRPVRFRAAYDAGGRDRLEAVVATVDIG